MQPYFDPTRKTTSKKIGRQPPKKMEDNLRKEMKIKWKTTSKKNGRQPQKKNENGRDLNYVDKQE
jgi:hypothetical protein